MHLWYPFCKKDFDRATEWLQWAGELGFNKSHTIILHPAMELGKDHPQLEELARKAFEHVLVEPDREGHTGWPEGPNCAFRQAAWYFYGKHPWLFQENDAWPLCADWLDRIEAEYKACGKPFMGDISPAGHGYDQHMSGVAVYPANTPDWSAKTVTCSAVAFDIADPFPIVQNMHRTQLIQHTFFVGDKQIPTFRDLESLSLLRSDAVLFHRNKDCTLPRRLRERMRGGSPAIQQHYEAKHIVYTYYDPVPGMPSQEWMIQKWAASWEKAGFSPVVLSRKDAETHSHFKELEARFAGYPTINPPGYELACWLRWLAMVQRGGGILVDYDVLPYGKLDHHLEHAKTRMCELPVILMDHNPCPCAVYGSASQFNNAVTWFANNPEKCTKQERNRPHASDQTGVQSGEPWYPLDIAYQYGREGWHKAPMVHYCHAACAGRPREQVIPEAEKLRELIIENNGQMLTLDQQHRRLHPKLLNPDAPATWIDGIRAAVDHLLTQSKASDNNRTRIMGELKAVGLTPGGIKYAPEKRKKGKRKVVAA